MFCLPLKNNHLIIIFLLQLDIIDMWREYFIELKNESMERILTMKMLFQRLKAIFFHLWIVITFEEENYINHLKKLAENDRKNIDHRMPNALIQGAALTVCRRNSLSFHVEFSCRQKLVHHR